MQRNTEADNWKHVGTTENSVDVHSRGGNPETLINNLMDQHG